jgi:hypothetical protein
MDGGGLITPSPETALVCLVLVLLYNEWETRMKPRRYKKEASATCTTQSRNGWIGVMIGAQQKLTVMDLEGS